MNNILVLLPDQIIKPMGGMGEQARNLFSHLSSDYHIYIIGSPDSEEYHDKNISYYPINNIETNHISSEALGSVFLQQALYVEKALSLGLNFDIVHAFDYSTFFAGQILADHYKSLFVTTIQLSIQHHAKNIHPLQLLNHQRASSIEMSGLINSDAIIQVSESYVKLFPKIFSLKTKVIHNGISIDDWRQTEKIDLPGNNPIKIIYIGRYTEMKNTNTLCDIDLPDNVDLIFIGSSKGGTPEYFKYMTDKCTESNNMHYVGPKYGQEKINYLMSADAIIMPSTHEPFGIVALEALASKKILLSSFVNGLSDFLTEDCAINCGTTKESIESAIEKFLLLTEEEKSKMIESGLKVCKDHDWILQSEKLEELYNLLLKPTL